MPPCLRNAFVFAPLLGAGLLLPLSGAHARAPALSPLLQHGADAHGHPRPDASAEARFAVNNVLINYI
jgi:hypothetical protein